MPTPKEIAYSNRLERRVARYSPEVQRQVRETWRIIREGLSDADVERLIDSGQIDRIVDDALLNRATTGLRQQVVETVRRAFDVTIAELPRAGKIAGETAVAFDTLNPNVIKAVRALDSRVINTLKDDVRETVRAYVENGLRDGLNPRVIAKDLGDVIGLAPNQEQAVRNYRKALESGDVADALKRKLRDKRYDNAVAEYRMTPDQIDKAVDVYRERFVKFNAETNARTATLDSMKLGQQLSWEDAVAKGVVKPGELWKRWVSVMDDRVRPEHRLMHGEEVPYDQYYSTGEYTPGDASFNCRCVSLFIVKRNAPTQLVA